MLHLAYVTGDYIGNNVLYTVYYNIGIILYTGYIGIMEKKMEITITCNVSERAVALQKQA